MQLLTVEHLYKSFNKHQNVLEDINLTLYQNECFCLVGSSGSGKTTLGKCLLRFIKPTSGNIYFKGKDIQSLKDYKMYVSFVPQDPMSSLNPHFKVLEAILEPFYIMSLAFDMKDLLKKISKIGIKEELLQKKVKDISGGERQRVAIARAMLPDPELIIADEPSSSLDAVHKELIASLFLDIKSQKTLMIITHDVKFSHRICDKIGVMYKGKIVEIGSKEDIFKNPKHDFTKSLLDSYSLDCEKYSYG